MSKLLYPILLRFCPNFQQIKTFGASCAPQLLHHCTKNVMLRYRALCLKLGPKCGCPTWKAEHLNSRPKQRRSEVRWWLSLQNYPFLKGRENKSWQTLEKASPTFFSQRANRVCVKTDDRGSDTLLVQYNAVNQDKQGKETMLGFQRNFLWDPDRFSGVRISGSSLLSLYFSSYCM